MLKCFKFFIVVLSLSGMVGWSRSARAQKANSAGGFGVGIGAATVAAGISLKSTSGGHAFQGVLGTWRGFGDNWRFGADSLAVALDFLEESPPIVSGRVLELGWNYGLGAGVGITDFGAAALGGTAVVGLEFNIVPIPLDITAEYRPGVYFIGDDDNHYDAFEIEPIDATFHVRLWF